MVPDTKVIGRMIRPALESRGFDTVLQLPVFDLTRPLAREDSSTLMGMSTKDSGRMTRPDLKEVSLILEASRARSSIKTYLLHLKPCYILQQAATRCERAGPTRVRGGLKHDVLFRGCCKACSKAHGHGIYYHADGSKYEGQWQEDKQHGQGPWT